MKLFWSNASPYARKVRMVIAERHLVGLVEEVTVEVYADPPELLAANPAGKIPALLTDEGFALFDSPVICAYLDAHPAAQGELLCPETGNERWLVMCAEALGDAITDLGYALTQERRKPDGEKSPTLAARQRGQLFRTLDAVPETLVTLPERITLGHLALACALGYIDFRHADLNWRDGRDALATWYGEIATRPSLVTTAPS